MKVHIDDDGCLCETCTVEHETCPVWLYTCKQQAFAHDLAPYYPPTEAEATIQIRIKDCKDYVAVHKEAV
jgi:hypothetical protein